MDKTNFKKPGMHAPGLKSKIVFVFALAFPSLNRLRMHNELAHFHCPSVLMWCSLHIVCNEHKD